MLTKYVWLWRQPFRTEGGASSPREALDPPRAWASVEPTSPGNVDRMLTYLVRMHYHPELSIDCIVEYIDHRTLVHHDLMVKGLQNIETRGVELQLYCEEVV